MNVETPPPLNDAATLRPSIIMRPSLARPPFAVKIVMNGAVCAPLLSRCPPAAQERRPGERHRSAWPAGLLMMSLLSTDWRRALCVSTTGVSPVTVIVSATAPTRISMLIGMTPDPVTSTL